jgi:archaellum biogenesis ATPase FlaH
MQNHQTQTKRDFYRQKVKALIREPLTEDPAHAYTTFFDQLFETVSYFGEDRPGEKIPGWDLLNKFLNGFPPNEFTILCGPTGTGKTTLLTSWGLALLAGSVPIYVASVEIGKNEFLKKMISGAIGKNFYDVKKEEKEKYTKAAIAAVGSKNSVLGNYDSRVGHLDLLADILCAHEEKGTRIALLDNLNFMMEVKSSQDQLIAMDRTVHDFVIFCKKVPIHVVMVMHPRKTENGRVISEFDVKGSSTSVQEAANVLLFNRVEQDRDINAGKDTNHKTKEELWTERNRTRELKIAKSRFNGDTVGKTILLRRAEKSEVLFEYGSD